MKRVRIKHLQWLPMVVLLSGCTLGSIHVHEEVAAPQEAPQQEVCPSCSVEKPVLPPAGDCAKAVAVVNYADSCQVCGRFPVTVRAYGQAENCK